jgi:hypothetical protein
MDWTEQAELCGPIERFCENGDEPLNIKLKQLQSSRRKQYSGERII